MFEIIFTVPLLILILWVLFSHHKTTEKKARMINMSLFSIKSIESFTEELDLLNIFKNMHLKGWNRFLYGDPYVSLEKTIQNGKTDYCVAIPKKYEGILEQNPHVLKIGKNILPEGKHYAVIYLHKRQPAIELGDLKLHEDEGVALQILARHIHPVRGRGALWALAASNGVHDGRGHFESNIRVMAWADSLDRVRRILNQQKVNERTNRKNVFDFFSRIFENNKRVKLSIGDLKNFLINKFVY